MRTDPLPSVAAELLRQSLEYLATPAIIVRRGSAATSLVIANAAARSRGALVGAEVEVALQATLDPPVADQRQLVAAVQQRRSTLRRWTDAGGATVTAQVTPLGAESMTQISWSGGSAMPSNDTRDQELRAQHELQDWLAQTRIDHTNLTVVVRGLLERLCELYQTERASVWLFSDDDLELRCLDLYRRTTDCHSVEPALPARDFADAFAELRQAVYVDMQASGRAPREAALPDGQLRPHSVTAMLDAVIRFGGRCYGTLCLEHVRREHQWQPREIDFACTIASCLATALESLARADAEEQVRRREQFLTAVIDGSPIGIQVYAPDGTSQRMNAAMQRLIGLPSTEHGIGEYNLLRDEDSQRNGLDRAFRTALTGYATQIDRREVDFTQQRYGSWPVRHERLWIESVLFPVFGGDGKVDAVVLFSWDVTDRVRAEQEKHQLEAQLQQSQKIEAVGMLAGGVAHDFNNILTAVLGFTDVLRFTIDGDDDACELVGQIRKAAERGAALTRQLLAFGRVTMTREEVFDASTAVAEMLPMIRRLVEANIGVELSATSSTPIRADRSQFLQVLLNLLVNARDATLHGGTITIQVDRVDDGQRGAFMRMVVRDTGSGMSSETKARLFEPFFTTKAPGRGTGLGLSTVQGIVTRAHGSVDVESAPGEGSTFTVCWPIADGAPTPTVDSVPELRARCNETVLVVEDDDDNRRLAARILEHYGYSVLTAASGEKALEVAGNRRDIDLLFTDVVMPGMGGRLLAEQMLERLPGLRVVFTSGYTSDDVLRYGIEKDMVAFVPKPYSATELVQAVRAALAENA